MLRSASAAAICCSLWLIVWKRRPGYIPFWRSPVAPPSSAPPRQPVQAGFWQSIWRVSSWAVTVIVPLRLSIKRSTLLPGSARSLGLLVTPSALVPILAPSFVIAAALMLVARPVAVALCLLPFRYTAPEIAFISWVGLRGAVPIFLAIIPVLAGLPDATIFFGVAFIVVLISLILQGWTVAPAARMFDLDVPPLQPASRLDIDLPGRLGDENTVAGYRVEARCLAVSKAVEALPLPPTASVLVVIRDGIARSAASAPPLAPGDYLLALARPGDLAQLDRVFGQRSRVDDRGLLGEFAFDGTTALAAIAHLYDPTAATDGAVTLAELVARRFGGSPAVGDRTRFGAVELIVRDMQGDEITQVGVELDPASKEAWRSWFQLLLQRLRWNNRGRWTLRHSVSETERRQE